ncbi:MAG: tRNA (adenosine(37)-N6)-dimethylallyltransferase MiaA [Clostridia bacterium]|nr:tRNA (adenosine(37)-N6)-dimethylallyltransferase MiaA [Clostridia bacterium]
MQKLIAVVGTNASGKSTLGIELARHYGGEVVSADSRQVYRGLDLGSGKVTPAEMQGVPHHLLDVCDPGTFFSVADYQRLAYSAVDGIAERGRIPFLVGGTGLYVDAVCRGYRLSGVEPDLSYRRELEKKDTPALYRMLLDASPDTRVDPRNRNRVMRQLEKLHDGDTLSPACEARYTVLYLGVTWDRSILCERIDERLDRRVRQGLIEEVQGLMDRGVSEDFLYRLGLEYRYISQYLLGRGGTREEMLEELSKAIKRFAKRQMTWFRRNPDIRWLDMQGDPAAEAAELADRFLSQ